LTFEHPLLLAAGILALALSIPLSRLFKEVFVIETPLGAPEGTPFKPPVSLSSLIKLLRAVEILGLLLLVIAPAGPLFLKTQTVWLSQGAEIVFVVDVSPSMACLDMNNKSRFEAARNLIRDFAKRRPSDTIGLVGVGRDASLLVPPTIDRDALLSRLDSLRLGELGDGTALGLGLAIAGLHISGSNAPRKAVVLLTDGENNAGAVNPSTGAEIIAEIGANLWIIAVGSNGQIPIDYVDPFTKIRRTGIFDSRFDAESLKLIAAKGNGVYIGAPSSDTLAESFMRLDQAEKTVQRSGTIAKTQTIYGTFIALGSLFLALARFVRHHIAGAFL
jgi:Ca-activated chloride channel family protein